MLAGTAALVAAAQTNPLTSDLFSIQHGAVEKIVRTVVVYVGILVIIRVAGKRLMAQMNSLDLVVVLLLSNVVQNAIIGEDNSLAGGLLGAVVLVTVNSLLDRWAQHNATVWWLLNGKPTQVITDGVVDQGALRRLGMTPQELWNALRQQGADDATEVASAEMEPGGTLTVRLKPGERTASIDDLKRAVAEITERIDGLSQPSR
jgi:uncharacterized membrane protein YcaP (DUF421 family)